MWSLLSAALWLASIGSLAHAGGVTTTTTTTSSTTSTSLVPITFTDPSFFVERIWTGTALGIPDDLGGLFFSTDGSTLYVVGRVGLANSAVFALSVVRDAGTDEITSVVGPAVQQFAGSLTGLDAGLDFGPGGTLFYSYFAANHLAQRPSGVGGSETTFDASAFMPLANDGASGLTFNPMRADPNTGFGRLLVGDGIARIREILLDPQGGGLFAPESETLFVKTEVVIGGIGQMRFLPAPLGGDLLYADLGDGQLRIIDIDSASGLPLDQVSGLPTLGTQNPIDTLFASGFGADEFAGPFGLAIDPVTNDLFVTTSQGTPANTIFQVEGFSTVITTTTTVTTTTTSTSTSLPTTTSTSITFTTTTTLLTTTSTSLPSTTSTSVTSTTSTSLATTTSTTLPSTTSTSLASTTSTSVTSTTNTSLTTTTSTTLPSTTSTSLPTTTSTTATSTTTLFTTTSTSSTTTTTVPGEECGNCLDDDQDGLTDFEDADCCGAAPGTLVVEELRLRPNDDASRLKLTASSLPALASLSPATQIFFVQLVADDDAPLFCAAVDAVHFRGKRNKATFTDRTSGVPSADGIRSIRLQRLGTGALRVTLAGARVAFAVPPPGPLRVAVALRSLAEPGNPTRCVVRTVEVVPGKSGGLELP